MEIKVVIEIPQGTNLKYEFDEKTGEFVLDFVFKNLAYPYNYGFIPVTRGGDGDTLDAMVLSTNALKQGAELECQAIGFVEMIDRGEVDNKIICVPLADPLAQKYSDIAEIPPQWIEQWKTFIAEVARQKNKVTEIKGFYGKDTALKEIKNSLL